jgi:hypothetical protein
VIFSFTSSGSNPNVSSSISTKTGFAPTKRGAFAVAINVKEGTITSFPLCIPCAKRAACKADVPELKVTAYSVPT